MRHLVGLTPPEIADAHGPLGELHPWPAPPRAGARCSRSCDAWSRRRPRQFGSAACCRRPRSARKGGRSPGRGGPLPRGTTRHPPSPPSPSSRLDHADPQLLAELLGDVERRGARGAPSRSASPSRTSSSDFAAYCESALRRGRLLGHRGARARHCAPWGSARRRGDRARPTLRRQRAGGGRSRARRRCVDVEPDTGLMERGGRRER